MINETIKNFKVSNNLSNNEVSSLLGISEMAVESILTNKISIMPPEFEEMAKEKINSYNLSKNQLSLFAQPAVAETASSENTYCDTCKKTFASSKSYYGHKWRCGKSEQELTRILKNRTTSSRRNSSGVPLYFEDNPPKVAIRIYDESELMKYIDADSESVHIFCREEDGSLSIFKG